MRGRAAMRLLSDGPPRAPDVSALASAVNAAVRFSVFAIISPLRYSSMTCARHDCLSPERVSLESKPDWEGDP